MLAGAASSVFADEKCQLTQYASLAMGTDSFGDAYVPVTINGRDLNLLVDTGGLLSMLTQATVQNLSLTTEPISSRMIVYMPGARITRFVHTDTIQLGTMKADHIVFFLMPDGRMPSEEGGTLAPDFMANYDVEFDFAKTKFNLYSQQHCPGQVVYWTHQPYAAIPFQTDRAGHIVATIQLDGKSIDATIDTGTSQSAMGFESARDLFDWDGKTADLSVLSKRSDGSPATYHFPFKSLSLSGVTVNNPAITLLRLERSGDFRVRAPKMPFLLGMSVLRHLHLYIACKEKIIYATPAEAY
jgi:predicted aspartyl protease